jgi:hypothetical protein
MNISQLNQIVKCHTDKQAWAIGVDRYLFNGTNRYYTVIPFINSNIRGCQGTVILPLKPRSFDGIGNFKILELCYQMKLNR